MTHWRLKKTPCHIWIIRAVGKLIVPPNGLGSHSLTHRPTENPTGVTHWRLKKTPCHIWIIRVVGKLIVSLHLTGLVRFRSHIALPKIQPE